MSEKLHATGNVYRVALLFLLWFKFTGLATFSLKKQRTTKKKCSEDAFLFVASKFGIFYNLLFSFLIIASNVITIPSIYDSVYDYQSIVTTAIEIFQGMLGTLVVSSILLYYCTNQSAFVRIGNSLIHFEGVLRRLPQPLNRKHIFYVFLVVYIFNVCLCVAVLITEQLSFHNGPVIWLANILPAAFVGLLFIQYFFVLTLMDDIFAKLNSIIQDLCGDWPNDICRYSFYQSRRVFVNFSTTQLLVQIREFHDHLCDVSGEISQFYSWPTLFGLSFIFCTLLYNTYYLFVPFMIHNETLNLLTLTNTLLWIVFLLYPLGLLTFKITKIVNEIGKTGGGVHALLNRTTDRESKRELEQFSLQLLHRKVHFTANGYFTLDNSLFQSMLATVATYMVILIQFQMEGSVPTAYSCNCTQP